MGTEDPHPELRGRTASTWPPKASLQALYATKKKTIFFTRCVVVHNYNPRNGEVETGGSVLKGQPSHIAVRPAWPTGEPVSKNQSRFVCTWVLSSLKFLSPTIRAQVPSAAQPIPRCLPPPMGEGMRMGTACHRGNPESRLRWTLSPPPFF